MWRGKKELSGDLKLAHKLADEGNEGFSKRKITRSVVEIRLTQTMLEDGRHKIASTIVRKRVIRKENLGSVKLIFLYNCGLLNEESVTSWPIV